MSERICHLCGNPATGFASTWTATEGEKWYCHGDYDDVPTCYERYGWADDDSVTDVLIQLFGGNDG